MTESFFLLIAWIVTGFFLISFVLLFVCFWIIYYRVIDTFKVEENREF